MSVNKVNLEIDGKKIQADLGSMIIEAADNHNVYIPRFCYHKKLSIAANCRMCLIEIDGMKKAVPACATPISEGMKIKTRSELARKSQKAVMEFLLINHPLDCPICDQGGQCELQDLAVGFGPNDSNYHEKKRAVVDENLGSLIDTNMTRCIHCTRCVRFLQEVAGKPELGTMGRGEHVEISTFIEQSIDSDVSGNIIDLCPVGALTSKPFRFTARAWELKQFPGIAAHDCLGSNINVHVHNQKVKRIVPRANEAINETWLSDRDRFSYTALNSPERLRHPMVKRNGHWEKIDWNVALEIVASSFENVRNKHGADAIAGLISANATLEELYLWQKLFRDFGCANIDHRVRQSDFSADAAAPLYPELGLPAAELANCDTILLVGSDIQHEQPVLALRLIKAAKEGRRISSLNCYDYDVNFAQQYNLVVAPQQLAPQLAAVFNTLAQHKEVAQRIPDAAEASALTTQLAAQLAAGGKIAIVLGAFAQNHPHYGVLSAIAQQLAILSGASVGVLSQGANAAGAWLAGAVPHRRAARQAAEQVGLSAQDMFAEPRRAYGLFNLEPELDCINPRIATAALNAADFVVAFTPFISDVMREYADVLLPIAPFAETAGTFVNCNGLWQTFNANAPAQGEARPGWKVLRVLGNFLDLPQFDYESTTQVAAEVKQQLDSMTTFTQTPSNISKIAALPALMRFSEWSMYRNDNLVRRSMPLQERQKNTALAICIGPDLAEQLKIKDKEPVLLKQGELLAETLLRIDARLPGQCVYIPAGTTVAKKLGSAFGKLEILKKRVIQ